MSYFLLNQLRCCRSRFNLKNGINAKPSHVQSARAFGTSDDDDNTERKRKESKADNKLGRSVILVQQDLEIRELPLIFRKYDKNDMSTFCSNELELKSAEQQNFNVKCEDALKSSTFTDPVEILDWLQECDTSHSVLQLYTAIPETVLDQEILTKIWDRIYCLDSGKQLKTLETESLLKDSKFAYHHLLDTICKVCDTNALLNMMDTLKIRLYMNQTIEQIRDEILMRTVDGCLDIMELCEAVHRFTHCEQYAESEKFWAAFSDQIDNINANNIKFIYEILPKVKVSRRMIVSILDRRISEIFPLLKSDAVADIMDAIRQCGGNGHSSRTLKAISRWLNVNIHAVSETHLERILFDMNTLNYSDHDIEHAIERFMKAKATKIKCQEVIVEIMRHIARFRLLNSHILNGCTENFINRVQHTDVTSYYARDLICTLGLLHFQPLNTITFWKATEQYLDSNFHDIPAVHLIDILLAAVQLQLFPVNFIDRVFNGNFMHYLHSTTPIKDLPLAREKLKILDTALTLECRAYRGPLLPRRIADNPINIDSRIQRVLNEVFDDIATVAGGATSFTKLTIPQQLPLCNLYAIDILFHPSGWFNYNSLKEPNMYVAALIHLPEHYDSTGTYLTGEQQMRIRHLRLIGMKVVSLNYVKLRKLFVHRKELREYFAEQMKKALPALKSKFSDNFNENDIQ